MTTPRKLTYDDLWIFKDMFNIALSPDGRRVALEIHTMDKAENDRKSAIWLLHLDEHGSALAEPRQLTSGVKFDTYPAWAPDSRRLLFISNREDEKNQLWLIDTDGGEARKLTNLLHGVSEVAWSPDGQWIAFTATALPTDEDDLLTGRRTLEASEKKKREDEERYRLRTVTRIWYRLDGRGMLEKFSQLFVMPAPTPDAPTIDPTSIRRLTSGEYDHHHPAWIPDNKEISVLCNRAEDRDRSLVSDLWAISPETGEARQLTDGTLTIESYAWSPDARRVILVGSKDMRLEGGCISRLYLVARAGGALQTLTADVDYDTSVAATGFFGSPGPYLPQWSPDGEQVYFLLTKHGCVDVYRLDMAQTTITPLTHGEHLVYWVALLPATRSLVIALEQPLHPWELYRLDTANTPELQRLTYLHDHHLAEFAWSKPERLRYRGANNDQIDGWVVRPIGARAGVRYPLILSIHGGPQGAYSVGMNPFFQYLAAQGYAVFYCNPHGSTSYGEAFMREVEGDWGGWDFQDIMRGVDECIAQGIADPERLLVTGYSYGGYMSMFIIGQTDRFNAAVPMAGLSNLASFVGTSDIGFWQVLQAKGYPWDPAREAYYRERSPLTYAARVTTPTCFIHPENDLRCPIEQTEQFYMTLKMMGKVPVEFVRSPAAWHVSTTKPSQYFARWEKMLEWFGRYVEVRAEEYDEPLALLETNRKAW